MPRVCVLSDESMAQRSTFAAKQSDPLRFFRSTALLSRHRVLRAHAPLNSPRKKKSLGHYFLLICIVDVELVFRVSLGCASLVLVLVSWFSASP